jgi:lipid-A-disaccharide synthase-like uncharacterized protein
MIDITKLVIFGYTFKDVFNLGMFGSGIFLLSWLLQSWESKKAGKSVVGIRFWLLRIFGLICVFIYGLQIHNLVFILTNWVGIILASYNIYLVIRNARNNKKTD